MAGQSEIKSKYEKAYLAINQYSEDLTVFKNDMAGLINDIRGAYLSINSSGENWSGELYNNFCDSMNSHLAELVKNIGQIANLIPKLDEYAEKLKQALDTMENVK